MLFGVVGCCAVLSGFVCCCVVFCSRVRCGVVLCGARWYCLALPCVVVCGVVHW